MKALILMTCVAAIALGGCRREEAQPIYEPMKLTGEVQDQHQH